MTTLPPDQNGADNAEPTGVPQPETPAHWNSETPAAGAPEASAPAEPVQPPAPEAPAAPVPPSFEAPPAAAYQAPPAAPPGGGYQAPPAAGYQQPVTDPVSTLTLNYWLSVFFMWIPALIFWVLEKDKGNQRATALHVANLNFSLVRTGAVVVIWILGMIPYIGWLLAALVWVGSVVLFVFHIIAATKVADAYRSGSTSDPFIFNIPMVK